MHRIFTGLRYSAISFRRSPGLALGLLLTVALGIGSNVVVHGFIRGLTVRDSPFTTAGRTISLFARDRKGINPQTSYEDFASIRNSGVFEWIGAAREFHSRAEFYDLSGIVTVAAVTRDLAGALNLPLENGAVVSHRVWQNQLRAHANVRGEQIRVDGADARVDGVAPDGLEGLYLGRPIDIWMVLREESLQEADRRSRSFWIGAGLRPDVSIAQVQAVLEADRTDSGEIEARPYTGITPEMMDGMSQVSTVLYIGTGIVFFIACANVASLLLSRASSRMHETSIRLALGAGARHIAGLLLSDSILISLAGGSLGALLAVWTWQIVPSLFFEEDAEQLIFAPDLWGAAGSFGACAGVMILCGLMPLFTIRQDRPWTVLRRDAAAPSTAIRRVHALLLIAQMTCCCVLMISTGLLFEGLQRGIQTGTGLRLGDAAFATIQARADLVANYRHLEYFQRVEQSARSLAGVSASAWVQWLPGNRPVWQSLRIEPQPEATRDVTLAAMTFTADSDVRLTLRAGRMFGGRDTLQTCRAAIINDEAAEELFEGDAVGRAIEDFGGGRIDIIGVVSAQKTGGERIRRPTVFFYGDQDGKPHEVWTERFSVPAMTTLSPAILNANVVSPSYFSTMGLPVTTEPGVGADRAPGRCGVAVVNREAAELYFRGNPIGAAVIDDLGRRSEIIGTVDSARLNTFQRRVEPAIYFQMAWDSPAQMTLILLTPEANETTLNAVRQKIEALPEAPAALVVKTLEMHADQTALAPLRIATMIIGGSTALAVIVSILGLHSALTDSVRRRGRELAVRVAMGARRRHVIFQVVIEGGRLAAAGVAAGLFASFFLWRFFANVADASPPAWVWVAAPLVLAAAVAAAAVLPARRALMVDPSKIMRDSN